MDSSETSRETKAHFSNAGRKVCSTKLAAATARCALTLAVLSALLLIAARQAEAQTETVLYNFTGGSAGANPNSRLTLDGDGNLYGTTYDDENEGGYGIVFELSPNSSEGWNETTLYTFTGGKDGANPDFSYVIFDNSGNLYGTTEFGGANGDGVVFELSSNGKGWKETVLHSFDSTTDGAYPVNGLIMDSKGNLYGTTGIVFRLSQSDGGWTEQTIYNPGGALYGQANAGLTMDSEGNIFGAGVASVFELSPNGSGGWNSTVIHTFNQVRQTGEVSIAQGPPALDKNGNIYGTTKYVYPDVENGYAEVYKISLKKGKWGTPQVLKSFQGATRGTGPWDGVVLDAAGNIYSTTVPAGTGWGNVFELVAPIGAGKYEEKVLLTFDSTDGFAPYGGLVLDGAGALYGTTFNGGGSGQNGVVFEVTP
jgi:uncharacterized repeat protein (TIGR03803 family)